MVEHSEPGTGAIEDFTPRHSIVRTIWGDADLVLLVFAGSAAEFALNRAVDWLFFTGKVPGDPIGRLFATAAYARDIVFADAARATHTLNGIRAAHEAVERQRAQAIPDWAHRDVLYMLIDYSERAFELLHRPLTDAERDDLYDVFYRVGSGLRIPELPTTYQAWTSDRQRHLERDLVNGAATRALYAQYRRHLGGWRYQVLLWVQSLLVPAHVRALLGLRRAAWLRPVVRLYPALVRIRMRKAIQWVLMPSQYLPQVHALDARH